MIFRNFLSFFLSLTVFFVQISPAFCCMHLQSKFLTVGNLLQEKSAIVGLKPDGVVIRNDAERIQAGRVLEEQVREAESHKHRVFNPCVGEFVAMMGQIDELQQIKAKIAETKAIEKAFESIGKPKSEGVRASIQDLVIDKLLEAGATESEIAQIVLNPKMGDLMIDAQGLRYGSGITVIMPGDTQEIIKAKESSGDSRYLERSLNLFSDGAVALDEFATQNPRLAQLSMLALDVALSGPSRVVLSRCSEELGIQGKIDECKDKVRGWLSKKVSAISELEDSTSELLVSGGMFGTGFAFAIAGVQAKDKVLKEAKNVADVKRRVGDAGKYGKLTEKKPYHDGMHAHHMPSERYLEANATMGPKQGFAGMMTKKSHYQTRTYGRKATDLPTTAPYRQELAEDLVDYIGILKKDGSWTPEVRRSLQQGLDNFRKEFPDLFRKVMK